MHHWMTNTPMFGAENPCKKQACFVHDNFFMDRTMQVICSCGAGKENKPIHMDENMFGEVFLVDTIVSELKSLGGI